MTSPETEVRNASKQFYAALNRMANGSDSAMVDCWSQGPAVTTMHPVGRRETGWNQVRDSFNQFSLIASAAQIRLDEQKVQVVGDLAYEVGCERGTLRVGGNPVEIEVRVTNIYRREPGGWKMVHHHSDNSPAMQEAVDKLMAKATARH
jgi:ketosteroid isomerase-like protein